MHSVKDVNILISVWIENIFLLVAAIIINYQIFSENEKVKIINKL